MNRFFAVVGLGCLLPFVTQAASLYIAPNTSTLYKGDTGQYTVRLDVDTEQCINAVDATIQYSENIEVIDLSTGGSIFSMWVEEPIINRDERTITFAGGIPNGYCGRIAGDPRLTNQIVDIIVQSPSFSVGSGSRDASSTDEATLSFLDSTTAYLNDGRGTQVAIDTFDTNIDLIPRAGNSVNNDWVDFVNSDTIPPTPFSIALERTENAFSNDFFITFATTDKQSGINYYEVMEEPLSQSGFFNWGSVDAPWIEATSPYVLEDQSLNSTIFVRAVDKAGNEYMAVLVPDESLRTLSTQALFMYLIAAAVGVVVIAVGVVLYVLYRRRTKVNKDETRNEIES